MTSLAPFLPRPAEPPNDARFAALGSPRRWEALLADGIDAGRGDGILTLLPQSPVTGLGAPDGSIGGLVPPAVFTPAADGRHVLLDRKGRRVLVFEPCRCAFAMVPCLPSTRLAPGGPVAVLAVRNRLYLSDSGAKPAVLVYAREGMVLRAEWKLPPGFTANLWQPGLMAWSGGRLYVADAANGAIHVFAPTGIHERMISGVGALAALATDRDGALWIVRQGETVAHRMDDEGTILESIARREDLASRFDPPPIRVLSDGSFLLDDCDPAPARFGADGCRLPDPPQALLAPAFTRAGTYLSNALDSRIETCLWHRVALDLVLPPGTAVAVACLTADVPLSDAAVLALPAAAWTALPPVAGGHPDVLITAPPGRYLWLRLDLKGPGDATPRVGRVEIEFPRVGLARMLPAAFRQDPVSADLTDRFTAVMDRPLLDVEARIDHNAALYDPEAAPAKPGADMLAFLASWLGLRFEGRWPVERRRRLLRAMGRLLYLKGTVEGLRQALIAYFGWRMDHTGTCTPVPAGCHPRCGLPAAPAAGLPIMLLEHWRLRRWLFLGAGRLGDAAMLWGAGILDKVELDRGARLGGSQVNSVHDTLRDPFHVTAWKFSLFLPARYGAQAAERASVARLVDAFRPAHAAPRIVYVAPRMRIGIQAAIGFDTVIARYPTATTTLGAMELGRGTITPVPLRDEPRRLGRDAALEATPIRQHRHGEAQP